MALRRHKWIFRLGIALVLCIVSSVFLNGFLKQRIKTYIADLPAHIALTYDDIHINSFFGNLEIENPHLEMFDDGMSESLVLISADKIEVKGLSYLSLIFRDKIDLSELVLDGVDGHYLQSDAGSDSGTTNANGGLSEKEIVIAKITITNSKLKIKEHNIGASVLSIDEFNLECSDVVIKPNAPHSENQMTYSDINGHLKSIEIRANPYDDICIEELLLKNRKLIASSFELTTKYTREDLSAILKSERDHFDIHADAIVFDAFDFGMGPSNRFYVSADSVQIVSPNINVFRDKLVHDSYSIRPLYGQMLRDLGIDLSIDRLRITNGLLSYAEKIKAKNKGGQLDFHRFNSNIEKLGNTYGKDTTHIHITSDFMGRSHLNVKWAFVVQNPSDDFSFSGELDYFNAGEISRFTQPNLNVDFKGELKKTYFNINGNPYYSDIDLQVNFEDFQVVVLKKNGKEKNKFLSSLVNMFVATDSDKNPNQFYYGNINRVERDRTKSVFNFVWKNLESALVSAMLGSGKKKD